MNNLLLALKSQQKNVAAQEKVLDKYDTNLATSYSHLSGIYQAMGNMPLALEYQQKTIAIFEKMLDKNDPDLAISYNNVSSIYHSMGDFALALKKKKKAIAICNYFFIDYIFPIFINNFNSHFFIYQFSLTTCQTVIYAWVCLIYIRSY